MRRCPRGALAAFLGASAALAAAGGAYGLLVGPLLRLAFGGEPPAWPPALRPHLPPPPSAEVVRAWLPWLVALAALLKGAAQLGQRLALAALSAGFGRAVRARVAWALVEAPLDAREAAGEARLHSLLTRHVERLERWVEEGVAPLWRDGAQVLTLALTAYVVSGELGLLVLALYPLLFAPVALVGARLRRAARAELSSAQALSGWALTHVRAASWLRAHGDGGEGRAAERAQHEALWRAQRRLAALQGAAPSFAEVGGALALAGSLGVFLEGVAGGRWRAEELLSLFVCLVLMYQPLKGLTRAQGLWAGARAAWDDLAPWLAPPARASRGEGGGGLAGGAEGAPPPLALLGGALARGGRVVARVSPGELRAGRITLVAGPNGVGKSTLLARLAGLNPPPPGEAPAAGCAWLGQGPGDPLDLLSLAGLSVADVFGRLAGGGEHAPWPLAPAAVFEALGLPPAWLDARAPRAPLDALSGGERRKLSLALALCLQRPLLLLDEPESHLDARSIEGLRALLIALAASGRCAVLVATHDARLAELATHALHLTPPTHDAPPMTLLP